MGGGDLNMKKSWHPVLLVNQERVWKAEKSANEEKKKLAQLRKEQEEERQLQDLQRLQEASTGKKRVEKLDWMYAAPSNEGDALGGARISETMMEDYLLGKRRVDDVLAAGDKNVGNAHKEFIAVQNANSARDTASKIREDPLLAIKRQEQAALVAMANRPDIRKQLKAIKKEREETKEERKARKRAEKEDRKREKSERGHHHRHQDDYSRSPKSEYSDDRDRRRSRDGRRDYDERDRYERRDSHRSRSISPKRGRRDSESRRYRDESPRRRRDDSPRRNGRKERDYRDKREYQTNGRDHDDRIPPPRHYPAHNDSRDTKPHPSRPSAMDLAERPTASRPAHPPTTNGSSSSNGNVNGNGNGQSLDEMRAARLAAMTQSADSLYTERTKSLAARAEEEKRAEERDQKMRAKYGKEAANAGFFKQQGELGLGESLSRRGGKGLQRDI